ncbi:choice-of-anchor F family protein [Sulfurovum sp. AR]|uniref:choice-of-anchor F family protein n=1 Tax=Sulfurovum sp. AR TaxID=1165841 RepID=UPI00025C4AFF|nr:choice-of-anchor F family protein [Sulfurovum sp. AR]EIF51257.1 hypothetical protein SULAR_03387 [Sulfurovum sp. AR]
MKKNYKNKILGMSVAAAMLLGSSVYAGKIIGATPGDTVFDSTQFGYGGWSLDNVVVNITSDSDFSDIIYGDILQASAVYPEMDDTMSFESIISTGGEVRGKLHGKDWPVGEPAGIKVINDDTGTKHGKPSNCIMTTSYLDEYNTGTGESGYLDTTADAGPVPTICSSGFQTHKRFKINLQPTTVNKDLLGKYIAGYGNPVDIVFKLDPNDPDAENVVRYQVFSKINNYTGARLAGYKVEVLKYGLLGVPTTDPNLTLSLGIGEGDIASRDYNIFLPDEFANFAHGLWGPIEEGHFDEIGFFDIDRAYYPSTLGEGNYSIYNTAPLAGDTGSVPGGNYPQLFGDWIHSEWAPYGIFYDDDNDPSTDADLMAFWGVPPGTNLPVDWYKGMADNWAPVDDVDLQQWALNPLYSVGKIEDVLNLGLNYIINVGAKSAIGDTFILRITPYVDSNQTAPIHTTVPPALPVFSSEGNITIVPEPTFTAGTTLRVAVADTDLNTDPTKEENLTVVVKSSLGGEESVLLIERDANSSLFIGSLETETVAIDNNGILAVQDGTVVTAYYTDVRYGADGVEQNLTAETTAEITPVTPPADVINPSSGGGGCTYNPDSKNFDMMFLVMMALGLLYPFRRRFIK